jgi:hypothetical protein
MELAAGSHILNIPLKGLPRGRYEAVVEGRTVTVSRKIILE